MEKNNLIFDLGFYNGDDTTNYIKKGYNVIAVEANPELYRKGLIRFKKEIYKTKQLVLLNMVFSNVIDSKIPFYIHPKNLDWSTADKEKADYWKVKYKTIDIFSINYMQLIEEYGLPYYIKCDIEGLDHLLIKQIEKFYSKPNYLSFELSRLDYYKIFSYLYTSGYKKFQLLNQAHNKPYTSGEFAEYLPKKWMNFDECLTKYMKYKELKEIDNKNLALGWVDIHAKK
ncbi:MAG: FkbM family methyltransferase [Promethearchaeota archaeon]